MIKQTRDDFSSKTVEVIAKRAAYVCSNPHCRCLTLSPSKTEPNKYIYTGKAAHITAAAPGGPRYDPTLTPEERSSAENGIYLCSNCADMIDKKQGIDYPVSLLRQWREQHERWVAENRHKSPFQTSDVVIVDGTHYAEGIGDVTGLDIQGPTILKPGTRSTATGFGNITATRIGGGKESDK